MIYIYDILLNFNDNLYEFYEWEKNDFIYHIKKILVVKVDTELIENILYNFIKVDNNFLKLIYNKTEMFSKKNKYIKYSCLFSDGYKVIGVLFDDLGNIIKVSDLLLDEASDALNITKRCNLIKIEYNIIRSKNINNIMTRRELSIKNYLLNEFNRIYQLDDIQEFKYLYFEYFNEFCNDINIIYNKLIKSLEFINDNHFKLYDLLKLCNERV